jgi:restriction system protein
MTFLDAAYEVLKQAGQPLHYTELANRALAAGLLDTRGQTPKATMDSRLYVDTQRPASRFRRVGLAGVACLFS